MLIHQKRTVFHLSITKKTVLRVVLYVAEDKIDWYNESHIHQIVVNKLQCVIRKHVMTDQGASLSKRQKESETNHVVYGAGCRIQYKFTTRNLQHNLINMEKDYEFSTGEKEDEKPIVTVSYHSLSTYPDQLILFVDDDKVKQTSGQTSVHQFFH